MIALARNQRSAEHGNASTLMVALGPRCLNCGSPDETHRGVPRGAGQGGPLARAVRVSGGKLAASHC
jgi:hypothetical protein